MDLNDPDIHDAVWWDPAKQNITKKNTYKNAEDAIAAVMDDKRRYSGVYVAIADRAVLLVQQSNGPRTCPEKKSHHCIIVQRITVRVPRIGEGTKIMYEVAAAAAGRGMCVLLQSPITQGGRALARKLKMVDDLMCREVSKVVL
jgi:hypothetical protein